MSGNSARRSGRGTARCEGGTSILPVTSMRIDYDASTKRVTSGVSRLDEMLGGEGYYRASTNSAKQARDDERWELRLYVAGQTPKSIKAFDNLKSVCEEQLPGRYAIEVVARLKNPRLAKEDQILALPTVVRRLPAPMRQLIGDQSDTDTVLVGLDLRSRS